MARQTEVGSASELALGDSPWRRQTKSRDHSVRTSRTGRRIPDQLWKRIDRQEAAPRLRVMTLSAAW
jgi:hypothetical protein